MNIPSQQKQIAALIGDQVAHIIATEKTTTAEDEAIVGLMPDWMDGFKMLMDTLTPDEFDWLFQEYPGFYRFSKMMEKIAQGCADGLFDDI